MPNSTLRTIVEDDGVSASIEAACADYPRGEEAVDGLRWVLARHPGSGKVVKVHGADFLVYVQDDRNLSGNPFLRVIYTYNEEQVVIHALEAFSRPIP